MGKRVVHFDTKDNMFTTFNEFYLCSCGMWVAKIPSNRIRITRNKKLVTCKNCLKKLGIRRGVVDEQKTEWAKTLVDWDKDSEIIDLYTIIEEAKQYLESLEG